MGGIEYLIVDVDCEISENIPGLQNISEEIKKVRKIVRTSVNLQLKMRYYKNMLSMNLEKKDYSFWIFESVGIA